MDKRVTLENQLATAKQEVSRIESDIALLAVLETKLAEAKKDLHNWNERDATREDGSGRQDAMHNGMGDNAKNCVRNLENQINALGN